MGHFTRNCPRRKKQANINLLNYEEDSNITTKPILLQPRDKVASVKQQLMSMTKYEWGALAKEMGIDEDFPPA